MAGHKPGVMLFPCHRISPKAASNPATPPDASHVPAPPCSPARALPSHQIPQHIPELAGKRQVTNLIPSGFLGRNLPGVFITPSAPEVPGDLESWLSGCTASVCIYTLLWLLQSPCLAKPSLCSASLTTPHHLQSPMSQRCPVTSPSCCVCVEVMAQKAPISPKGSV